MSATGLTIVVCGGRDYGDEEAAFRALDHFHGEEERVTMLIQGGAAGADTIAADWAKSRMVSQHPCPARWSLHGQAAKQIRNEEMLSFSPDAVLAFPGGEGTADMLERARKAAVPVWTLNTATLRFEEEKPASQPRLSARPADEADRQRRGRDLHNRESAEAMLADLRRILDAPGELSVYRREDGTLDEELIGWTRAVLPWVGRHVTTQNHGGVLEITRNHAGAEPELRFCARRLNKDRRAAQGVARAIVEALESEGESGDPAVST